jgi:bifunctional non-homologous end joining protein LigD
MKAVAGDLPTGEGWAYEVKWDGMRVLAEVAGGAVVLRSARGADVTAGFPELDRVAAAVPGHDAVLDGEVVAFDDRGRPSFARLQGRMHVDDRRLAAERARSVPVTYVVFDLLEVDGTLLVDQPYRRRRDLLESLVEPSAVVSVPGSFDDGAALLAAAERQGLEGVVAKRLDSTYRSGGRSPQWRKVKVRLEQEFVVAGWLGGTGAREGAIGSLVLGCHEGGELRWAGNVGTGFSGDELGRLGGLLAGLAADACSLRPPPQPPTGTRAHWVRPDLVVQVAFGEWTPERRLRHPSYLGQREDKDPAEVTCEG